jgi:hypothetical protein
MYDVNARWGSVAGRRQLTRGKHSDRKRGCCRVLRRRAHGRALWRIVCGFVALIGVYPLRQVLRQRKSATWAPPGATRSVMGSSTRSAAAHLITLSDAPAQGSARPPVRRTNRGVALARTSTRHGASNSIPSSCRRIPIPAGGRARGREPRAKARGRHGRPGSRAGSRRRRNRRRGRWPCRRWKSTGVFPCRGRR